MPSCGLDLESAPTDEKLQQKTSPLKNPITQVVETPLIRAKADDADPVTPQIQPVTDCVFETPIVAKHTFPATAPTATDDNAKLDPPRKRMATAFPYDAATKRSKYDSIPAVKKEVSPKLSQYVDSLDLSRSRPKETPSRENQLKQKVVELIPAQRTSPDSCRLTIDKTGNTINYTIERDEPSSKLTIIQEGKRMVSPKLMKHIYKDVLSGDTFAQAELIDSLSLDRDQEIKTENQDTREMKNHIEDGTTHDVEIQKEPMISPTPENLNSVVNVDHSTLIFGPNSQESSHPKTLQKDSLEGYTYHHDQPSFDVVEFKKSFGIRSSNSCDEEKIEKMKMKSSAGSDSNDLGDTGTDNKPRISTSTQLKVKLWYSQ